MRRPEVPGFCPSNGVVSIRETLKSTMVCYLIKEKRNLQVSEKKKKMREKWQLLFIYRIEMRKRERDEGKKGEKDECTLRECFGSGRK